MARKKPGTPDDLNPPGMTDAAGMLVTYAAGFLAQPASRAQEVSIRLGHAERAMLVGLPELDVKLKGRLDILSTATTSIRPRWTNWPASACACPRPCSTPRAGTPRRC